MSENLSFLSFQKQPPRKSNNINRRKQILDKIIEKLSQQKIQVFYLDGREISSKETFLRKVAEAMNFPTYFGVNWDALDECITDLTWCPAQRYVLFYERPDIFAQADPDNWQTAINILRSAEEYWETTNTPLDLFLIN
ncbi:MAG: barstar family protein [Scytonema sp. PMC 1069.18]|nr:barstar family protein [Scytonema sp. PMC 1069.18]MEC4884560.1 barstar family protein [Scytonema sp. PMC 1070.18]